MAAMAFQVIGVRLNPGRRYDAGISWNDTVMGENEYLTPQEVADKLRIHERTVRRLLTEGRPPGARIGAKKWRVSAAALQAYIEGADKPSAKGE